MKFFNSCLSTVIYLLLCYNLSGLIFGQSASYEHSLHPQKKITQYVIERWGRNEGLPGNAIENITQSKEGYIWLVGFNGLIRFDGFSFHIYNSANTPAIISSNLYDIKTDAQGNLYFAMHKGGVVKYANGKFENLCVDGNFPHVVECIWIDKKEDKVWVGTREKGIYYIQNKKFIRLEEDLLKNVTISQMTQDSLGGIWIGTENVGLVYYQRGKITVFNKIENQKELVRRVSSVYLTPKNELLVGTEYGLCQFIDGKLFIIKELKGVLVYDIVEDNYGCWWMATNSGLVRKNTFTNAYDWLTKETGLPHNELGSLYLDKEGSLWVCGLRTGLVRLKQGKFTNFGISEGLTNSYVSFIMESSPQEYYIGTDDGMINILKDNKIVQVISFESPLPATRIRHIAKDKKNTLWVVSYQGMIKKDAKGKETFFNKHPILPDNTYRCMLIDKEGYYWIGSRTSGIIKINEQGDVLHRFNKENGLTSNFIMQLKQMSNGDIWVATNTGGVNVIRNDAVVKSYTTENGLADNLVFDIEEDEARIYWIATNSGISRFDGTEFINFGLREGLITEKTLDLIEDNVGNVWISCNLGIMRVFKKDLEDAVVKWKKGEKVSVYCRLYDKDDGMLVSETSGTSHAIRTSDGQVFFPTLGGIAMINPIELSLNKNPIPVFIHQFTADDVTFDLDSPVIEVPAHKKRFVIHFSALTLLFPQKIQFRYKLDGFDKDWVEGNSRAREATYTNLPHGHYRFRLLAANEDGIWNTEEVSLSFYIQPHFYQRRGVQLFGIFIFLLAIFLIYRWRVQSIKQRNMLLMRLVDKRTAEIVEKNHDLELKNIEIEKQKNDIIRQKEELERKNKELEELNEEKNQLISILAHDLKSPLSQIKGLLSLYFMSSPQLTEEQKSLLHMIELTANRMKEMIIRILDVKAIELQSLNLKLTCCDISQILSQAIAQNKPLAQKKQISLHAHSITSPTYARVDEQFLFQVYDNLLSNAIKFSPKYSTIHIHHQVLDNNVRTQIKDEGPGLTSEDKRKLFRKFQTLSAKPTGNEVSTGLGLAIVKKFVDAMNGQVWCESEYLKGASFFVEFPLEHR